MSKILNIDTATDICSVSLSDSGNVISFRDSEDDRSHSVKLAGYVDEILRENNLKVNELDAVSVSKGPGSYTGLRIGVSIAKGLCYGAGVPLLSVSTLEAMCYGVSESYLASKSLDNFYFIPMLDARRMEVYSAVFTNSYDKIQDVKAVILDEASYSEFLAERPTLFFGSGAEKFESVLSHENALFYNEFKHSSKHMAQIAEKKFNEQNFEDVAYFEPFYLKDFVTTTPKKSVLFGNKT